MIRYLRLLFILIAALLVVTILLNLDLARYAFLQAKGQLQIVVGKVPLEQVLQDTTLSEEHKKKIHLIMEIRKFAQEELGLKKTESYTSFYQQPHHPLLWNLSASHPFRLKPKKWSFPILGTFPYKGFFDKEEALEEEEVLKNKSFDTRIRPVSAWSTLGWFDEPVLSGMLTRSEADLADLIIHELMHATVFIKDNVEFNENLASFIGEKGAVMFLKFKYGDNSFQEQEYLLLQQDRAAFAQFMLRSAKRLEMSYEQFPETIDEQIKRDKKHILIDQIVGDILLVHFHNNGYYKVFDNNRPNNATFLSYMRYHNRSDSLRSMLQNKYEGDLSLFIKSMKR